MNKLLEAIGQYGVQCSETKELAPPQYLLDALDAKEAYATNLRAAIGDLSEVIEQKHTALLDLKNQVNKFCEEQGEWDFYTGDAEKALALTPDLSALKEN